MDIGRYVAQLRDDLTAAAAAGDEQTRRTAALLGAAVEPATRSAVMNTLADLAAEITAELGDRTVEVRLDGRDVRVAVGPEHVADAAPTPPPPRGPGVDTGDISRITLRLVEQIKKGQAEQAAAAQGVSLNSWVAQAVQGALCRTAPPRLPRAVGRPAGRRRAVGVRVRPDRRPGRRAPPARLGRGLIPVEDLVRQESRTVAGPADLDLAVDVGRVVVHLDDAPGDDEAGDDEAAGTETGALARRAQGARRGAARPDGGGRMGAAPRRGGVVAGLRGSGPRHRGRRRTRLGRSGRGARGGHRLVHARCRRRGADADGALDHRAAATDGAAGGDGVGTAGLARDGPDRRR